MTSTQATCTEVHSSTTDEGRFFKGIPGCQFSKKSKKKKYEKTGGGATSKQILSET